jgi:hypothetical protein
MTQRTRVQTPIDPKTYARAVLAACDALGWLRLSKEAVGVLHAQFIVETSGVHCWNWNLGNVKVTPSQVAAGIPWIDLPGTWEVINGKRVTLPEGDPGRRFRAFDRLDEAMVDHLRMLKERRFRSAWPAVLAGDPALFAHKLKEGPDGKEGTWDDYFTAPVEKYAAIMKSAHAQFMRSDAYAKAVGDLTPTEPAMSAVEEPLPIVHASPITEEYIAQREVKLPDPE